MADNKQQLVYIILVLINKVISAKQIAPHLKRSYMKESQMYT